MTGYTVIDLETTGLVPQKHDRIVEIGVVFVSDEGVVEGQWSTLVDPERDVGPTRIHGITARDVLGAPTFAQIAPLLVESIAGRTLVAHNARFDTAFVDYEFARCSAGTRPPTPSLCTMQLANSYLRGCSRKLKDCCRAAHVEHLAQHTAIGDAGAVAGLLAYYLSHAGEPLPWQRRNQRTRDHWWPPLPPEGTHRDVPLVVRSPVARRPDAWLDRLTSTLPRNPEPRIDAYLDVLEQAMLDMYLSAHEEQALIDVATNLGLQRDQLTAIHATYLDSLAIAAWADGVVTDDEHEQLTSVAGMLGLPPDLVRIALARAERVALMSSQGASFKLRPGDQVVFTGQLSIPRERWIKLAIDVGLVHGGVSKTTKIVVAADPDSQSGKAAKARAHGIPVVTEAAFARLLADLP